MKYLLIILITLISLNISAQEIIIKGNAPSYANKKLIFYSYKDLITYSFDTLKIVTVSNNGSFDFKISKNHVTQIHVELGIYDAFMYAEPNTKYNIVLPPRLLKSKADSLNPFFTNEIVQIGIKNGSKTELNFLINKFNRVYAKMFFSSNLIGVSAQDEAKAMFSKMYRQGSNFRLDSIISKISMQFKNSDNQYFQDYMKYKFAALKNMVKERSNKVAFKKYLNGSPVLYNNISYMEFFNNLFKNYFYFYSKTPEGKRIIEDIHLSKSVYALKHTLSKNISLYKSDDELLELIILKGLYDAYSYKTIHTIGFKKAQIYQTLDSLKILTKNHSYKSITKNIRASWEELRTGYPPPNFNLISTDSLIYSLDSFKGKFIYLNFMYTEQTPSIDQAKFMNNIYDKNKDKIEFVSIIVDRTIDKMHKFKRDNKYQWTFLHNDVSQSLIDKYKIVVYPTFFLISPEGKMLIKNAPSPTENFEKYFFDAVKRYEKKEWLKENKNK